MEVSTFKALRSVIQNRFMMFKTDLFIFNFISIVFTLGFREHSSSMSMH